MNKSIKMFLSAALVVAMLMLSMITVSASELNSEAEVLGSETELQPMAASYCGEEDYAITFTRKSCGYTYTSNTEIRLKFDDVRVIGRENSNARNFKGKVTKLHDAFADRDKANAEAPWLMVASDPEFVKLRENNASYAEIMDVIAKKFKNTQYENDITAMVYLIDWCKIEVDAYYYFKEFSKTATPV